MNPMELFTMTPLAFMRRFAEEMDRNFWGRGMTAGNLSPEEEIAWMPPVEVRQSGNNLIVSAELPGLTENDVQIEATEGGLIIRGERCREYNQEEGGVQRTERSYGQFWRLIPLPEGANIEEAKATFNNGVLEVTIPVPESEQKRRQIPISTGQRAKAASQSS
jgi:HSP20 family protein